MKVIYTDQSYESLNESIEFLLDELNWPIEKVLTLRKRLLDKAEELAQTYNQHQKEEYLAHLEKGHRRTF